MRVSRSPAMPTSGQFYVSTPLPLVDVEEVGVPLGFAYLHEFIEWGCAPNASAGNGGSLGLLSILRTYAESVTVLRHQGIR